MISHDAPFIAAVVQMISGFELSDNLQQAQCLIQQAVQAGAELVVLPENFAIFGAGDFYDFAASPGSFQVLTDFLSGQAKDYGIWLVAGSIPVLSGFERKVFSVCKVFNPQGIVAGEYKKIHLFDVDVSDNVKSYRESSHIQPGSTPIVVDMNGVRLALAICYDLRFPELFRFMGQGGFDLIALPSAFTKVTGKLHWEPLIRARAIENQCYFLASNQGGLHVGKSGSQRETFGHSMIVDYQGRIIDQLESGSGLVLSKIDLLAQKEIRNSMPVLKHRVIF